MTLLIVEDNAEMRRLIKSLVAGVAEEVYERNDGSQALAAYEQLHPDWVLMDIEMPEWDGLAATRQIVAAFPDARVVIVTQYDNAALREAARLAGACGYVQKDNLLTLRAILEPGDALKP